jgi:hypothetical protein
MHFPWALQAEHIDPSEVRALPLAIAGITQWPLLTAFFSCLSLSSFFSPRSACSRVLKF